MHICKQEFKIRISSYFNLRKSFNNNQPPDALIMQFEHKGIYSVLLNLDFGAKLPVSIIHVSLRLYSHLLVNNREWFVSLH